MGIEDLIMNDIKKKQLTWYEHKKTKEWMNVDSRNR